MKKLNCLHVLPYYYLLLLTLISIGCQKSIQKNTNSINTIQSLSKTENKNDNKLSVNNFQQTNLVSDNAAFAPLHLDAALKNAWGLAFTPNGFAWVSDQAGHVSTIYDREGNTIRPPVSIPSPGGPAGGNPTGVVFNASPTDFILSNGNAARFIFVGVDGILSAWNSGNSAILIKNNAATSSYTGLTLATKDGARFLYAANFRANRIDVWDRNFMPVTIPFIDTHIPWGYAPFNIQAIGDRLFVMYAKVGPDGRDQAGEGLGFVDEFNTNGILLKRLAAKGPLNAPWGAAMAPNGFFISKSDGKHDDGDDNDNEDLNTNEDKDHRDSTVILIGNFGNGRINAFNSKGKFLGQLRNGTMPLSIDGLWSITFPPSTSTIDPMRLYFTAGPNHEQDGLFGYLINK